MKTRYKYDGKYTKPYFLHHFYTTVTQVSKRCRDKALYTVVSRKRAHGWYTLLCAQTGGGWIFVTSLHFTTKKRPCLHYHKPTYGRILHTNNPSQYKVNSV